MLLQTVKMPDVQRDVLSSHRKLPLPLAVTAPALLRTTRLPVTAPARVLQLDAMALAPLRVLQLGAMALAPLRALRLDATAPVLLRTALLRATAPLPPRAAHRFYPVPAPLRQDALLPPEALSQPVLPRKLALRKTTGEALLQAGGAPHRNARLLLYTIY